MSQVGIHINKKRNLSLSLLIAIFYNNSLARTKKEYALKNITSSSSIGYETGCIDKGLVG
jgi:hypothetical protein